MDYQGAAKTPISWCLNLGGGTFDVSILKMIDGVMEVPARAVDYYLYDGDFLDLLQKTCITTLQLDENRITKQQLTILRIRLDRLQHSPSKPRLSANQEASQDLSWTAKT